MARGKPLTDEAIAALVGARVRPCTSFGDTTLATERETLAKYYDAQEPRPLHKGNSKYVSQDVFDSVEMAKAILLETFVGNDRPVRFAPIGPDDVRGAHIATEYTNHVIFTENDGFGVFHDVIHDGLMNRAGIAQVLWRNEKDTVEETLRGVSPDEAAVYFEDLRSRGIETTPTEIEVDDNGETMTISYKREADLSRVVVEQVPPEEFGMSPRAKSLRDASVVYRRTKMTRSELIKEGYDRGVIEELTDDPSAWDKDNDPEVIQRHKDTDDGADDTEALQDSERTISVFTVYTRLDVDGEGVSHLYKVIYAGGKVLDKERVRRKPFILYTPLRKPHSAWGSSYADRVVPTQNARTVLTRSIIDHSLITTNPRHTVVRGSLVNPKELLENRLGGVVNVTRPDAVQPLMNAPLNPFVLQTIALLDDDNEKNTGVSRLSQGLNKDAISKQNSADLVQTMVTVSQQRQKIMARNFAYGFLSELFLLVYELVLENQSREKVVQIAGDWVPIAPYDWCERNSVHVEFHLGHQEKEQEFQNLVQIDQYFRATPGLAQQYQPPQQYALIQRAVALKGIRDLSTYLLPPDKAPPPEPDPFLVKEWELKEREVAVKETLAGIGREKMVAEQTRKANESQLKALREQTNAMEDQEKLGIAKAGQTLKVAEFAHQREMDHATLAQEDRRIEVEREQAHADRAANTFNTVIKGEQAHRTAQSRQAAKPAQKAK